MQRVVWFYLLNRKLSDLMHRKSHAVTIDDFLYLRRAANGVRLAIVQVVQIGQQLVLQSAALGGNMVSRLHIDIGSF